MHIVHWMQKSILYSSIGIALFVAMLLSPTSFAFAATSSHPLTHPKATHPPAKVKPLDGGGDAADLEQVGPLTWVYQ